MPFSTRHKVGLFFASFGCMVLGNIAFLSATVPLTLLLMRVFPDAWTSWVVAAVVALVASAALAEVVAWTVSKAIAAIKLQHAFDRLIPPPPPFAAYTHLVALVKEHPTVFRRGAIAGCLLTVVFQSHPKARDDWDRMEFDRAWYVLRLNLVLLVPLLVPTAVLYVIEFVFLP